MTDVVERPAAATPQPHVRLRADVRRQIKLVVILGLVLLAEL
jgi:general nucleoside transport system permease protein